MRETEEMHESLSEDFQDSKELATQTAEESRD